MHTITTDARWTRNQSEISAARIAVEELERRSAYRLRYEVYIAEQGKAYPEANHDERLLSDEVDLDGEIIIVESGGDTVGTVRANWFNSYATVSRYGPVFELNRFPTINHAEMAVCSRLAASADHRRTQARSQLFEAIYARGLERETKLCFATCAPILLRMFRRYGFREYIEPMSDPVVGNLHRTVLVLDDLEHLQRSRSPFFAMAIARNVPSRHRPWLEDLFGSYEARYARTK